MNRITIYPEHVKNRISPFLLGHFAEQFRGNIPGGIYMPENPLSDTDWMRTDVIEKMKEAAAYIVGEHDFKSFCCVRTQAESTVRTIYSLEVLQEGSEIIIRIKGNGFLYNMVRIIAGTLIQVGKGRFKPEYVKQMLEAKDRTVAGQTAPPQGLTLVGIEYVDNDDARVV